MRTANSCLIALSIAISAAFGQHPVASTGREPLPQKAPKTTQEKRTKLDVDPSVSPGNASVALGALGEAPVVSVCELLERLPEMADKDVRVRGILRSGPHGQWLSVPAVGCPKPLQTGGFVWSNSIALRESRSHELDIPSVALMDAQISLLVRPGEPHEVTVTFIGNLKARVPPEVMSGRDGSVRPIGLGPLGMYPAELEYWSVSDTSLHSIVNPPIASPPPTH